jgi:hypothetical protein
MRNRNEVYGCDLKTFLQRLEIAKINEEIGMLKDNLTIELNKIPEDTELTNEIHRLIEKKQKYRQRVKEWQ